MVEDLEAKVIEWIWGCMILSLKVGLGAMLWFIVIGGGMTLLSLVVGGIIYLIDRK